MDFPRLKDTAFPNLGNVNPYAYANDFDYGRWVPSTKLKLVNVRWNGDYEDVVKFESDEARDAYFDSLASDPECTKILNSNVRMDKQQVKVPIPFDVACQYNYLVVDVPIATSADNMVAYETANGFRRWHFFIEDWQNSATNTTILTLALDVWTQYINSIGVNYMTLERGHAPVAATDTETYLSDPMDNSEMLLAPDVDFGGETVSRGGKFVPFGNGEKLICFASTCEPSQLSQLGTVNNGQAGFTDPVFSNETAYPDETNRWGYQYKVSGFSWGTDKSYAGTATPAGNPLTGDGRIPNNATVYAIESGVADAFLNDLLSTSPTFLKTLLGCFMVDSSLVTVKRDYTLAGYTVYMLEGGSKDLTDVKLTKDMFAYPEKYERFAKLYTFPYAELEVTDNQGKTASVRIESTGNIKAKSLTSVAFPYLNMRAFLTGIGGQGSQSYQWTDLTATHAEEMPNSDWYKFCYDFELPMYALYMDGQTAWNIQNYNREISNARNSSLISYHNAVRQADNAYANSVAESNTAETNAKNNAQVQADNAIRSSNTMQTNTNNQANTLVTNNTNSCNAATAITNTNNAAATANKDELNKQVTNNINLDVDCNTSLTNYANGMIYSTTQTENQQTVATTGNDVAGSIGAAMAGTAAAGAIAGSVVPGVGTAAGAAAGAVVGGVATLASSLVSSVADVSNSNVITQANEAVANTTIGNNNSKTARSNRNSTNKNANNVRYNTSTNANSVNAASANTATSNNCSTSNTANDSSMMKTNAANLNSTNTTNATNANSTAQGNAARTKSTSQSNALYTRNATVTAAQDVLRNTQNGTKALANDSRNMNPVTLCTSSGDMTAEYTRTRGIQIKVRTQSRSAIKMAGDTFARYGYALNQIWDVEETGLCLMKHFTYWKANDCWVFDKCQTNDTAQNAISALFKKGVTVWSDPSEVGRINPYDN